jgi:hypothetical protein
MKQEISLQYTQEPATGPYLGPDDPSPQLSIVIFIINFNIFSHQILGLPIGLLSSGYPNKSSYAFLCHERYLLSLIVFHLIILTIFGEGCKL